VLADNPKTIDLRWFTGKFSHFGAKENSKNPEKPFTPICKFSTRWSFRCWM